jgi:hypothetical protein
MGGEMRGKRKDEPPGPQLPDDDIVPHRSPFPSDVVAVASFLAVPALLVGAICVRCLLLWGEDFGSDNVVIINGDPLWTPAFKPMEALWLAAALLSGWIVVVIMAVRCVAEWRRERT